MAEGTGTSEPVLSTRQLNRALLARQQLLDRAPASLVPMVEQVAGLPARYGSAYVSLFARLGRFHPDELTAAIDDRSLVQATLMRHTTHLVSDRDFVGLAAGIRHARRRWWLRVSRARGLAEADYEHLAARLADAMAEGPRSHADLLTLIEEADYPRHAFEGVELWLDLVQVPPGGTWTKLRSDRYALADHWLDPSVGPVVDAPVAAGIDLLVLRYLQGFGPASAADISAWAGVPAAALEPSLDRVDLRRFRDAEGTVLFDEPYGLMPDPEVAAPVRFLPPNDAVHLVHAKRAAIVSDEHRDLVRSISQPTGAGTFLVDGVVAGTWTWSTDRCAIEVSPFEALTPSVIDDVAAEADRLARFVIDS